MVLEDRHQGTADGQAGAVQRVQMGRPAAVGGPAADAGAARLIGLAVGAGGDLAVGLLARQPDLEIVGLGGGDAHVAGRQRHHAVGQLEQLQHSLGVPGELLESVVARPRRGELHQLHLVELVLTDEAAHVLAVGAGLGPETRRVGDVAQRQLRLVEDLVAVQVGQRHLGGGHQIVRIVAGEPEQVVAELGQLAGAGQRVGVDDERRQHLTVAVLAGVQVEHEVDQRPLEPRPEAPVDGKAGAGELGAALEVEDAQLRSEIPVCLGLEVEGRRLPHQPLHPVGGFVLAQRHAVVRQVGQLQLDLGQLGVDGAHALLEGADAALEAAHLGDLAGGVAALALDLADLAARLVAPLLELFQLDQHRSATGVEAGPAIHQIRIVAAAGDQVTHPLGGAAQEISRQHDAVESSLPFSPSLHCHAVSGRSPGRPTGAQRRGERPRGSSPAASPTAPSTARASGRASALPLPARANAVP